MNIFDIFRYLYVQIASVVFNQVSRISNDFLVYQYTLII